MAKIQSTIVTPIISLKVATVYPNDVTTEKIFKKGGNAKFRYIEDCMIKDMDGRVADISFTNITPRNTKSRYRNINTIQSYFAIDNINPVLSMDISALYHSFIEDIDASQIIEDAHETGVIRMDVTPLYGCVLSIELSDGSSSTTEIMEGKKLKNVTYVSNTGDTVFDAHVIAITYDKDYNPLLMETIVNGKIFELDIKKIKSIEGVYDLPADVINDFEGDITTEEINDILNS